MKTILTIQQKIKLQWPFLYQPEKLLGVKKVATMTDWYFPYHNVNCTLEENMGKLST